MSATTIPRDPKFVIIRATDLTATTGVLRFGMLHTTRLEDRCVPAVRIQIDYSLDSAGFFADPLRRELLAQAAEVATARINDSLAAIAPGVGDGCLAQVENPSNGQLLSLPLNVAADTLVIYVGGRDHDGSILAEAVAGQQSGTGSPGWVQFAQTRGRVGNVPTVWGGSISFDTGAETNFYFDRNIAGIGATQPDFLSVATHEIYHILGVGISVLWVAQTVYGEFHGRASVATFGGPVPLSRDRAHWDGRMLFQGRPTLLDPVVDRGQRLEPTALDDAVLRDIGWSLTSPTVDSINGPLSNGPNFIAAGAGQGADPVVAVFDPANGVKTNEFIVAPASFRGGVRVATADVDGDGWQDLITGYGPGATSRVRIISGQTGETIHDILAFEPAFRGGVFVTAADLNGDGKAEIIATPDEGGGPRVRIFDAATGRVLADFLGIEDVNFRGGARAAVGDLNADGVADLLVGAGYGGGPRLAAFDGRTLTSNNVQKLMSDFFVFEPNLRNGVFVAVSDLNADGFAEAVVGGGPGGGPRVYALDGRDLLNGVQTARANFFVGDRDARGGVRLTVRDIDGDGRAELLTAEGPTKSKTSTRVQAFDTSALGSPAAKLAFRPFGESFFNGVFVG